MLLFDENYGSRPGGGATFGALHGRLAVVSLLGVVAFGCVWGSPSIRVDSRLPFQLSSGRGLVGHLPLE